MLREYSNMLSDMDVIMMLMWMLWESCALRHFSAWMFWQSYALVLLEMDHITVWAWNGMEARGIVAANSSST